MRESINLPACTVEEITGAARASMLPQTVVAHFAAAPIGTYFTNHCLCDSGTLRKLSDEPSPVCTILPPRWFE